jgi:hypothetical protein
VLLELALSPSSSHPIAGQSFVAFFKSAYSDCACFLSMLSMQSQVCDRVLRALQLNDDPMLDYGAAVLVKFSSEANAASQLSPSAYGRYLRTSEFEVLLENSRFGLKSDLKVSIVKLAASGLMPES